MENEYEKFQKYEAQIRTLYSEKRYIEAATLAEKAGKEFPDRKADAILWQACLYSMAGEGEKALDKLEAGIKAGLWWGPSQLLDSDLDSIRGSLRFGNVLKRCKVMTSNLAKNAKADLLVVKPKTINTTTPVIFAIHGQNWNVNTFSKVYDSNDLSSRYILAFPESSQPLGNSSFCWDDEKKAKKDIMISFNRLRSEHKLWDNPIVMSGFSQGAPFAIEYALDGGEIPAVGFIAIVPAVKDGDFAELSKLLEKAKRRSVKGIIIVGEHDVFWKEKGKRLYDYMIENGIQCKLVMSPKGHQFPDNFDKIVTEFMRSF